MAGMANPFALNNRQIIRSVPNEFDKATIISVYPRALNEKKETIFPGVFHIPAGTPEKPSITVVGPSSWFKDLGEEMPAIEIPNNAVQVANSIVTDYCGSIMESDRIAGPGLWFLPGPWTLEEIKSKYSKAFNTAVERQKIWFARLLNAADAAWAESNGSPKSISDLMRMAAEQLGMKDKDWMRTTIVQEMIKCAFCGNLRNPNFPICGSCNRVVDAKLAKERGLVEAT